MNVSHISAEELNGIIQYCPSLQNLTLKSFSKRSLSRPTFAPDFGKRICPNLSRLSFEGSKAVRSDALSLIRATKLKVLEFMSCDKMSKDFIKTLVGRLTSSSLEQLHIRNCSISDSRFARLLNCGANLQSIVISACPELGNVTLINIANVCKNLLRLDLSMLYTITDEAIVSITTNCTALQELNLVSLPYLSDISLRSILQDCHNLVKLRCCHCPGFYGEGLLTPAAHTTSLLEVAVFDHCEGLQRVFNICEVCPLLRELRLDGCYEIKYGMFTHTFSFGRQLEAFTVSSWHLYGHDLDSIAPGNLPHLRSLDLSHCKELTDEGMLNITRICPNLRRCILRGCESLSNAIASSLVLDCAHLQCLDVRQCPMVTEHGLLSITAGCSGLRHLALSANRSISCFTICALAMQPLQLTHIALEAFPVGGAFFSALMELLDCCPTLGAAAFSEPSTGAKCNDTEVFLAMLRRIYPQVQISQPVELHALCDVL